MKLNVVQGISEQTTVETLGRQTQLLANNLDDLLNSGLTFKDNFRNQIIGVTFSAANTDTQINHNLGIVPTGYLVIGKTVSLDVYNGSTNVFTKQFLTLKSSVIGFATIIVF